NDQGEDPWGSKVALGNGCQTGHSGNAEEQSFEPADDWSNRNKPQTSTEGQGDPWGSKVASCQTGRSAKPNAVEQSSQPADGRNNWIKAERSTEGNNQGEDQWGSKIVLGNECQTGHSGNAELLSQPADGWSSWTKAERTTEGEHESWKGNSKNEGERIGWSQPLSSNHGQADSWNRGGGASGGCSNKGDWEAHIDRSGCLEAGKESGNSWTKATTDGWGNQDKAKSIEDEHKSWKSSNEGEASGWNKSASSNNGQSDNWSRGASTLGESDAKNVSAWGSHNDRPESSEGGQGFGSSWGKADKGNIKNKCETGAWTKAVPSNCGHTDNWESWSKGSSEPGESDGKGHLGRNMDRSAHFEVGKGSGTSWDKATMSGQRNWNKAEKLTEGDSKSWKASDTNEGENDGWSKARTYNHDHEDRWNRGKGVNGESGDKVDWGGHSLGFGYGRGSGGNRGTFGDGHQDGGWSRRPDTGGGYGSSWGRGRSRNCETYGSGDKPDSWNRSRDSDGQQARGRGRGFNDPGGQDDSWKGSCSDAGWGSSRGRGRGGRGGGFWQGRGRRDDYGSSYSGHDGNDPSFGWKNDQGSSGKGDFSRDALSSWKNDQGNNWNRQNQLAGNHPSGLSSWSTGDSVRSDDQSGDWSGGKSYGGDRSSGRGYGRGRGRGKCFGQEQASGWRGGMCSNQEPGGDDATKGTGGEESLGQKAKGTLSSWDSGAGNRATGSGTHSDWNNSASTSGWTSCKQGNSDKINAEASAWDKGAAASQDGGWGQKKCFDVTQGSDIWKTDATSSKTRSGEACQGTDNWNKSKGCNSDVVPGWNSTSVSRKDEISCGDQRWNQKVEPDGANRPRGWGNSNASGEELGPSRTQRDAWSREKPREGGCDSRDGKWLGDASEDGSAERGGW
ncbi:hypothetical protein Taro_051229, partial [Colocasia esculenta]|nr:hypothetical protein [Colocasia esculenta]